MKIDVTEHELALIREALFFADPPEPYATETDELLARLPEAEL